jgi:hypothetical protein
MLRSLGFKLLRIGSTQGVRSATGQRSAVLEDEISKFSELSSRWWDAEGPMGGLHQTNPTRIKFIRSFVSSYFGLNMESTRPLCGLRVLDVGCGAGIASEVRIYFWIGNNVPPPPLQQAD